jgi:hypothetical protein
MHAFAATLNPFQRRLYAAIESCRLGRGGDRAVSQIIGICPAVVGRGRKELADLANGVWPEPPTPCGGRPLTEARCPALLAALEKMIEDEIAGDSVKDVKWVRSSSTKLAGRLRAMGFAVSSTTVWRLLKRLGYSMRINIRRRRGNKPDSPERDQQFEYLGTRRREYLAAGWPVISVDTKNKELIGDFMTKGKAWCKRPHEVNDHDFTSLAVCRAVPFGVYDLRRNEGFVVVGVSNDTPEFAVRCIAKWWRRTGTAAYPGANRLLIFADCGGTNSYRCKAWKQNLQKTLCDRLGLVVTVCHYPPGCSKWNPIEYRLFSQISLNWAGRPLRSLERMLGYIRGTSTRTGLAVRAELDERTYRKGQTVSKEAMERLSITPHAVCPEWNYTISPRR